MYNDIDVYNIYRIEVDLYHVRSKKTNLEYVAFLIMTQQTVKIKEQFVQN